MSCFYSKVRINTGEFCLSDICSIYSLRNPPADGISAGEFRYCCVCFAHITNKRKDREMAVTADEITMVNSHEAVATLLRRGMSCYGNDNSSFSSTAFDPKLVIDYAMWTDISFEAAAASSRAVLRSYQWVQSFMEKATKYAADPKWDGTHSSSGITYTFEKHEIERMFHVAADVVYRELSQWFKPYTDDGSITDRIRLTPVDTNLSLNRIGDPTIGTVQRAMWLAKRNAFSSELSNHFNRSDSDALYWYSYNSLINLKILRQVTSQMQAIDQRKMDKTELISLRGQLLSMQEDRQRTLDQYRLADAGKKFNEYWTSLKDARPPQGTAEATISWSNVPLLPTGVGTSRTWGIEIETVRANETSRPSGWESRYDGSLPGGDNEYCDCGCDDCYNGEHCDDSDDDCHMNDGEYESREYVSPILRHYNSAGLRQLCDDLGTKTDESSAPGIHVHVGASDLTVFDVTRILTAYSAIQRLIVPILHRHSFEYCHEMSTDQLRWWLAKLREWQRSNPDSVPTPIDIMLSGQRNAAPSRYVDLNLQALTAHETIEFRSMGAWYDYEHLVRWAWFAREFVNVSKLGIDQREWTSCQSIDDVVNLLRKYGSELPDSQLFADCAPSREDIRANNED